MGQKMIDVHFNFEQKHSGSAFTYSWSTLRRYSSLTLVMVRTHRFADIYNILSI